ncbi:MAG: hypothetical protein KME46_23715 [Brasilonema angustatum HA4187-MV1]|nr:hypothetical protein [Brasilonema angustatum HA4187-MV1]
MNTIYFDSLNNDTVRRQQIHNGQLFVFSPRSSTIDLSQFVRNLVKEAFGSLDPTKAEYSLPVDEFLTIESDLKQTLMNHPDTKQMIQAILKEFECDLSKTYFDLPQLRMAPTRGYLPNGEGLFHDPHRDTWYAAPMCLLNWWIPIYDLESERTVAFHPRYWNQPVNNDSRGFEKDYKTNFREAEFPHPEKQIEIEPEIRIVCPASGLILFSGAQMHSAVPNTSGLTRLSLDFRTVHYDDIVTNSGATNIDSYSTVALLTDFMRGTDLAKFPEDVIATPQKNLVIQSNRLLER